MSQASSSNIDLTESDQKDLIKIIQRVLPEAPNFKVLLESQLRNAKKKNPKHRRWSGDMISLMLEFVG